jgi:hypothetical protein
MPPRDSRPAGDRCEVTLRDTFAAAALTGLLSNVERYQNEPLARQAFEIAGFMLKERLRNGAVSGRETVQSKTNLDASPEAKATADRYVRRAAADGGSDRTDKAAPRPSEGTGETLSNAEIDALQRVVEDGRFVDLSDYGRLRLLLIRLRPEWGHEEEFDMSKPVNGPDPDSRVWETQRTPQPQATPPRGSVRRDGSVPCSRTGNDPAAWAVTMGDGSVYEAFAAHQYDEAVALARKSLFGSDLPLPLESLYRQPQPTLTDTEREAVEVCAQAAANCGGFGGDHTRPAIYKGDEVAAILRGLLARLK